MARKIIDTPAGAMLVPKWKIREMDKKTNEELLKEYNEVKAKGFIEPFLFNELRHRGVI